MSWVQWGVVLIILSVTLNVATATPPGYPARRIATITLSQQPSKAVVEGLRQHDEELRQTDPRWQQKVFVWDQATVEFNVWRGRNYIPDEANPSHALPRQKVFVVTVPVIEEGTAWIVKRGLVVTGYQRKRERVIEDRHQKIVIEGGKRTVHSTGTARSEDGSIILGVHESVQRHDTPIYAQTATFLVTQDGAVYY